MDAWSAYLNSPEYRARKQRLRDGGLKGVETRRQRYPHLFQPPSAEVYWQRKAHNWVKGAIKRGVLPKLDGSIQCGHCAAPATVYEHRDYGRPLDVVPACHSCNRNLGTAKWPEPGDYNFKAGEASNG